MAKGGGDNERGRSGGITVGWTLTEGDTKDFVISSERSVRIVVTVELAKLGRAPS